VLSDWGWGRRLEAERESLGLYLSGHPFEQYLGDQPFLCTATLAGLAAEPPPREIRAATRDVTVAGLVAGVRKRGARVSLDLDDGSGILEVGLFAEAYDRFRHLLSAHSIVSITGTLRYDEFIDGWRLAAREVVDLDRVVEGRATGLVLRWRQEAPQAPTISRLREALERFRPGRCAVTLVYEADGVQGRLRFGPDWAVRPTRELRESLSELVGVQGFRFVYESAPTQS